MNVQQELINNGYILDTCAMKNLLQADPSEIIYFMLCVKKFLKVSLEDYRPAKVKMDTFYAYRLYSILLELLEGKEGDTVKYGKQELKKIKYCESDTSEYLKRFYGIREAEDLKAYEITGVLDVLRVATYLSGGDPALPKVPKISKVRKEELEALQEEREKFKIKLDENDTLTVRILLEDSDLDLNVLTCRKYYQRFLRLAEQLRVGKYREEYPKTFEIFNKLRNYKMRDLKKLCKDFVVSK